MDGNLYDEFGNYIGPELEEEEEEEVRYERGEPRDAEMADGAPEPMDGNILDLNPCCVSNLHCR
jgi:hypothetical protein